MKLQIRVASLLFALAILTSGDLLACGDKFLVGSRGTRYQRPKNARTASIVIYANPSSNDAAVSARVESLLNRHGHRATIVTTLDQLSALLSRSRFDVILAATDAAAQIQKLFGGTPEASAVVTLDARPNATRLLSAIDKAVEAHDLQQRNRS